MQIEMMMDREELKRAVELWNRSHRNYPLREGFVEQNLLAPYTGVEVELFSAHKDGDLAGMAALKWFSGDVSDHIDHNRGFISLFTAEHDVRGRLLDFCLDFLGERGAEEIRLGGDPQNFLPGLPAEFGGDELDFWQEAGFEAGEPVYDLKRTYGGGGYPLQFDFAGDQNHLRIVRCERNLRDDLLQFLEREFPGRWHYEARNICRWPAGLRDYWLLLDTSADEGEEFAAGDYAVLGFARVNRSDGYYRGPNLNWPGDSGLPEAGVGPLGLAASARGRGLSLPFLDGIFCRLYERGYREIIIDWTELVEFYNKFGFDVRRRYIPLTLTRKNS